MLNPSAPSVLPPLPDTAKVYAPHQYMPHTLSAASSATMCVCLCVENGGNVWWLQNMHSSRARARRAKKDRPGKGAFWSPNWGPATVDNPISILRSHVNGKLVTHYPQKSEETPWKKALGEFFGSCAERNTKQKSHLVDLIALNPNHPHMQTERSLKSHQRWRNTGERTIWRTQVRALRLRLAALSSYECPSTQKTTTVTTTT